jgi:hypothetical protein
MVYTEYHHEFLTYALWDGYSWRSEKVDDVYTPISLAVNSKGEPHILYYGPFACHCLRYAYKIGDLWNIENLPFAQASGSVAIDDLDRAHISFTSNNGTLGYAFLNETSWEWTLVEGATSVEDTSLSLDSKGHPHISYYDALHNNLMYATLSESTISADVDIDPDTLNLKSKGRFVTAYIELEGADVRDIDASSIRLNDIVSPVLDERYGFVTSEDSYIVDHDEDGLLERMVKFDRTIVEEVLSPGLSVTLRIAGQLRDGTEFEGTDAIKVIDSSQLTQSGLMEAEEHETWESFSNTSDSRNVVYMRSSLFRRNEITLTEQESDGFSS